MLRPPRHSITGALLAGATVITALTSMTTAPAHADALGYLTNITVRPGYNFPNADAALAYGHGVCDKFAAGRPYAEVISDIKTDLHTTDEFQASYLVSQSVGELCPALIWQVRNSAAHYQPAAP